jgi:hypothetical protein
MTLDILDFMVHAQSTQFHLETAGASPLPLYSVIQGNLLWDIKGSVGYPWDGNSFDEQFVYQNITEISYTNSSTFKMFASTSRKTGNGGIVWAPRYFTPGALNGPYTSDPTYRVYTACGKFTTSTLGGPATTQIEGPYDINFGGTIGVQSAIVQKYFWGWGAAGYANMEVNYFVQGLGHVQWELYNLVSGAYVLKQTSAFNTQVAGGVPTLVFPCGVPVI